MQLLGFKIEEEDKKEEENKTNSKPVGEPKGRPGSHAESKQGIHSI